jgi:hypothetical protein
MYESIVSIMEGIKQDIITQYRTKNIRASGSFERNIRITRIRNKVVMFLPFYSQFITSFKSNRGGRGPGPIKDWKNIIGQWIKDKGFPLRDYITGQFMSKTQANIDKVAFPIARKIMRKGTDIKLGKRQPIDLDIIINNQLDYRGEELADRILQDITERL